jgi:hypothetical protein
MNESYITGCIAGALQFVVAGYALWLNRRYGTARVGWTLFCAFSFLALLQLVQSMSSFDVVVNAAIKINVIYALISFLLLIGMLHLEAMLKERSRMERVEKQLRAGLELEVKSKTAHLTRALDELMKEMEETKRMGAIFETSSWTRIDEVAGGLASGGDPAAAAVADHPDQQAAGEPVAMCSPAGRDGEEEQIAAGILGGEWIAHF